MKLSGTTSTTALQDAHTRLVLEIYVGSNAILGKSSLLLNRNGLTHKTWVCCKALKYVCYIQYVGQRVTKLTVLLQPYLLQVVYMTFQRLTVSCILAWYLFLSSSSETFSHTVSSYVHTYYAHIRWRYAATINKHHWYFFFRDTFLVVRMYTPTLHTHTCWRHAANITAWVWCTLTPSL